MSNRVGLSVKICCIQDEAEMRAAARHGATHVGLVGPMPSGPGPLGDDVLRRLASRVPAPLTPVLLTARETPEEVVTHVRDSGLNAVQLVRPLSAGTRNRIRRLLPGLTIIQVVHVRHEGAVREARSAQEGSDFLLLDSGRPEAPVEELGGTGRTHDWRLSARIVAESPVPVFLAGGLRPDNVAAAVATARPHGVDVCSGLRTMGGQLDTAKLAAFMGELERIA